MPIIENIVLPIKMELGFFHDYDSTEYYVVI